jgi:hypothetical protein
MDRYEGALASGNYLHYFDYLDVFDIFELFTLFDKIPIIQVIVIICNKTCLFAFFSLFERYLHSAKVFDPWIRGHSLVGIRRIPNPVRAGSEKACALRYSCRIYSWKAPSGPCWRFRDSAPWYARAFPRRACRPLATRRRRLSFVVCQLMGPGLVPRDMIHVKNNKET